MIWASLTEDSVSNGQLRVAAVANGKPPGVLLRAELLQGPGRLARILPRGWFRLAIDPEYGIDEPRACTELVAAAATAGLRPAWLMTLDHGDDEDGGFVGQVVVTGSLASELRAELRNDLDFARLQDVPQRALKLVPFEWIPLAPRCAPIDRRGNPVSWQRGDSLRGEPLGIVVAIPHGKMWQHVTVPAALANAQAVVRYVRSDDGRCSWRCTLDCKVHVLEPAEATDWVSVAPAPPLSIEMPVPTDYTWLDVAWRIPVSVVAAPIDVVTFPLIFLVALTHGIQWPRIDDGDSAGASRRSMASRRSPFAGCV